MNYEKYIKDRQKLCAEAQAFLDAGDIENANAKTAEIEKLDEHFENVSKASANLKALEGAAKVQAMQSTAVIEEGVLVANLNLDPTAQVSDKENVFGSKEYQQAFMNYVTKGDAIPEKFMEAKREMKNEFTTVADSAAVIPTTIVQEIIKKMESYGEIYARVRKTNIMAGVRVPIADLMPEAEWVTETAPGADKKVVADDYVTFSYHMIQCKISQSLLSNVVSLDFFNNQFATIATDAVVKAVEIATFNGTGSGQPLGILKDTRVKNSVTLTPEEISTYKGWAGVKAMMKKAYRNGSFVMNQATYDLNIDGMVDTTGQPIARVNYGLSAGDETYRFMGKEVLTTEDAILPSWEDAAVGDVFAVFVRLSDYAVNSNMQMQVVRWTDNDTNQIKTKALMIVDGKILDPNGVILIKKGETPAEVPAG